MPTARILIEEHEGFDALNMQSQLRHMGFDVEVVPTAAETAVKQAPQQVSEGSYRTLFEHSPNAIFVLINQRIELVNLAGLNLLGVEKASDLCGRSLADMTTGKCAWLEDRHEPIETSFIRPDGSQIPVECTAVPCIYEAQEALQIVARDISVRKRAEAATLEQRALADALRHTAAKLVSSLDKETILRSVLEMIERVLPHDGSGIILFDDERETPLIRVSSAIAEKINISPNFAQHWPAIFKQYKDEITNQKSPYLVNQNPEWAAMVGINWVQSVMTAPILSKDKLLGFLTLVSHRPNLFTEEHTPRLQAFANQVAIALENAQLYQQVQRHVADLERRVAQRTAELDQERGRLQAILDAAGEAIYLTDASGKLLYVNPATERITGYCWAELEGKSPHVWRSEDTPEQTVQRMEQAYAEGQSWRGEIVVRRQDGQLYDASLSMNPIRSRQGTLQGYVYAQRDITHLKELARLKDAFASQIGHELRTPITNIRLYHDLLTRKPEHISRYISVLKHQTDRLENLVEGFIEVSLLNADALPTKAVPINCGQVMEQLKQGFDQAAARQQIVFKLKVAENLPLVLADENLLHQALRKLLENALDYSPAGGQVTLETAVAQRDGRDWVICTIADNGPGVAPNEQPYLFERFYRGKAAQELGVPGAGLGLAICREIVSKLGGDITLVSKPDQGAAFTVWLPQAKGS